MALLTILFLAILQGLTEFLPISSSGHLVLAQSLLNFEGPALAFDVVLHVGTTMAILVVFKKDLQNMAKNCLEGIRPGRFLNELRADSGLRSLYLIGVASIPTGILGLCFRKEFSLLFERPAWVGVFLMGTGILLWFSGLKGKQGNRGIAETSVWIALIVGLVQGFAIIPGFSRSGWTIVIALFLGLRGEWAARFSFLMSIPAILAATFLEFQMEIFQQVNIFHMVAGILVAMGVGIIAIKWVMNLVEKGQFRVFSYYVFPLGLTATLYFTFWA